MRIDAARRKIGLSNDSEVVYRLVGLAEGGLVVREGAPGGPIFVVGPEDAAALFGCGVGEFIECVHGELAQ